MILAWNYTKDKFVLPNNIKNINFLSCLYSLAFCYIHFFNYIVGYSAFFSVIIIILLFILFKHYDLFLSTF